MLEKGNDKPRTSRGPSVSSFTVEGNQSHKNQAVKIHEVRRNHAVCLRTGNVGEPHYFGITVLDLPTGGRIAVAIAVREIKAGKRAGQKYLAVSLEPTNPQRKGGKP